MKLKNLLTQIAAAAALSTAAMAAQADTYQFTLSGDYTASWTLNSTVVADDYADGIGFMVWDIEGNFPGSLIDVADLTFWHGDIGGGLSIDDYYGEQTLLIADGPQLYTGTEDSPTFILGSYNLTEYEGSGTYTLTISAVPEPASIALMLAGIGIVGGVAVRRRKTEEEAVEA
jgi:hypothetical protein